jgi:hypothetical protein
MKHKIRTVWILAAVVLLLAAATMVSQAQKSGPNYDISWYSMDGGGGMYSTGGHYSLGGTIGQPDAGPKMSGGKYSVVGGFWAGMGPNYIYLPVIIKH